MNKTDFTVFPSGRKDLIFHKKKKRKREERILQETGKVKSNETIWKNLVGEVQRVGPAISFSFLLFHFHLETVEEPSSEGLRGAARCETGAQKRSFTRGNDAREKEKKVGGRRRRQVKKRERV